MPRDETSTNGRRGLQLASRASLVPLVALFLLNVVDDLDTAAYAVLLPEIRDHFHLSGAGTMVLVAAASPIAMVVALLFGYLGDRRRRLPFVRGGAAVWGLGTLATGLAPSAGALGLGRAMSGAGKTVNFPIHQSLLADHYAPSDRPATFMAYYSASSIGRVLGAVIGAVLAGLLTWRAPFVVFAALALVGLAYSLRLREPVRGREDRLAGGADEITADVEGQPANLGETWRSLYTVATVRRLYLAVPLLAASFAGIAPLLSIYYNRVFGLDQSARAVVFVLDEPFTLLGLIIGGPIIVRLMRTDPGRGLRLLRWSALGSAACILLMVIAPTVQLAVAASMARAMVGAVLLPTVAATLAMVVPMRARSLGFAVLGLWYLPTILVLPFIGSVGDDFGMRVALLVLVPLYGIAAIILAGASRTVAADIDDNIGRAVRSAEGQQARVRLEEAVERGDVERSDYPLVEIRNVHFSYGQLKVLFGIDLTIPYGSRVALLGANGAGKSTLLDVISGLATPDIGTGGSVWYKSEEITFMLPEERTRLGMVAIAGGQATFPSLSVEENLRIGAYPILGDRSLVDERVAEVLDIFPVLGKRLNQRGGTLSGGEQQMMALGRALIAGPELLMVDELSLGLAPIVMQEVLRMVEEIAARGTTILLIEQSLNIALSVTEQAYLLEKGEIVFSGPTSELIDNDALAASMFLGHASST